MVDFFDHLKKLKFSKVAPTAFTERGLYMLATILKSEQAVTTTLAIIDTFVRVRELSSTMEELQTAEDGDRMAFCRLIIIFFLDMIEICYHFAIFAKTIDDGNGHDNSAP